MKNFISYICCEFPYNKITNLCSKFNSFFHSIKQNPVQNKIYSEIPSNIENNEEISDINNPAKILSSEEINEMIKDQIKYSKEQNNANGYKIIKQKSPYDSIKSEEGINVEEIKKEINQIEFEEEEQKQNNKKIENDNNNENNNNENNDNNNNDNNEEILDTNEEENINLNLEELRKDVLENNDDLD